MGIRVKHPRFTGLTGHTYKALDEVYEREVPIGEALPRLYANSPVLAELATKGLITAVYEREGHLFPLNIECWVHSSITSV
jgi:hypothetical protein